jgi:HK97 family phage portal protein
MNIMGRLPRPKAMNSHELEKMIRSVFGGGSTHSGVSISTDTAMREGTVFSCVNILSRVTGMLPCHIMESVGETRNIAKDFHLYPLLHDMPNNWMTSSDFWGMSMVHQLTRGNFFAFKNTGLDPKGKVRELIPLAPGRVQKVIQAANYELFYEVLLPDGNSSATYDGLSQPSGTIKKIFPASQMFHLRGLTVNGIVGINPIQYVRESIGLSLAAEEFGARYFGQGIHPGIIVEHPQKLKDTETFRKAFQEVYAGLGQTHQALILEEGMKANKISIDPKDAQFLELRKFQKNEIVDIFFGMPLTVMNSGDNVPTYASAEQFSISFVIYALLPWLVSIEKAIYRDLLSPEERKIYYAKFQARGLQRGSFSEQMTAFQTAINTEIMNPNECRELLDMNPYEGGEVYRTRTSTVKEPGKEPAGASQGGAAK